MQCWVICFDIEDDAIRRRVGKRLLAYGKRVQWSVFEVLVGNAVELDRLRVELDEMIGDAGNLRLYPLCRDCRRQAIDQEGKPAVQFPHAHVL
ncbi:MAG: CRISPR-associated endonuclease Cas2 [Gammaproteobacteria bacterium]|nr:MAG: CRISPR-associated endonuclease Cas2 [Gammaproteobacteria bacterium]